MEICYKQASFQLTKALSDEGSFEAYVAAYNNVDFGDDIIDPQAFNDEPAGKTYPLLSDHETKTVIGNFKGISDGYGFKMTDAKFNLMRDEKTGHFMVPKAAEKYANLKNGDISGFSVGYVPTEVDWKDKDGKRIRVIKKAKMMEGSVVTFPMNDKARLLAIKSVSPSTSLPLAERDHAWDSSAAEKRIRSFTKSEEEPSSDYKKYFMYFDAEEKDKFGAYKLPFVDIINGKAYIVPRAVFAIAGVLEGARGGVNIPDADKSKIKGIVNRLYSRMAKEFDDNSIESPLKGKSLEDAISLKEVEGILKEEGFSVKEAKTLISKIKKFSPRDEEEIDETLDVKSVSESLLKLKSTLDEIELKKSLKNLQNIITNK